MDCMALSKWIRWLYFHGLGGSATMEYSANVHNSYISISLTIQRSKSTTPDIKVLRSQIKSLDYIRKRSSKYREYNKQLEQKRNLDKQRA